MVINDPSVMVVIRCAPLDRCGRGPSVPGRATRSSSVPDDPLQRRNVKSLMGKTAPYPGRPMLNLQSIVVEVTSEVYLVRSGEVGTPTPGSQEGRKAWATLLLSCWQLKKKSRRRARDFVMVLYISSRQRLG